MKKNVRSDPPKHKGEKKRTVYVKDEGQTLYSMAGLYGRTPEEQEEFDRKRKNSIKVTGKERWAMLNAAFSVYGPILLIIVGGFAISALLLYLFLK